MGFGRWTRTDQSGSLDCPKVPAGLAMAAVGFNIQHDGGHGAYSRRPWVNRTMALTMDAIGASSYVWHWKHNIVHHTYVNIAHVDSDIDLGVFGRLAPRFQHLYLWPRRRRRSRPGAP